MSTQMVYIYCKTDRYVNIIMNESKNISSTFGCFVGKDALKMGKSKKTIIAYDYEIDFGPGLIQLYKGKPVIDVDELPDGSFVMYYCDENEVPLPDSPKIICKPDYLE